tara:strand:- start:69 stop:524 length:456 start_codon:yes stop_codon:yes gene_type:complete
MKDYTKFIENLILKIASSINENLLGLIFLEKLKFDFLENIEELDKKDYEEFLKSIQNDKEYKKTLISGKRNLEISILFFKESENMKKTIIESDSLIIVLEGLNSITVADKLEENKSFVLNINKKMGIVLSKSSNIIENIKEKSVILILKNN